MEDDVAKFLGVIVVCISYAACAQIESGTIIVLNITKDKIIMAADSRVGSIPPDDTHCKIFAFGHKTLFTGTGNANVIPWGFPLLQGWRDADVAHTIIAAHRDEHTDAASRLNTIADQWADTIRGNWENMLHWHPNDVLQAARKNNHVLTVGLFIEQHHWWAAVILLVENPLPRVGYMIMRDGDFGKKCWPCHQKRSSQICALGEYQPIETIANFCSENTSKRTLKQDWATWTKQASPQLRKLTKDELWPMRLAELAIAKDTSGTVHLPVDLIETVPNGSVRWLYKKPNCPENQD